MVIWAIAAAVSALLSGAGDAKPGPVDVMIVGTYHFASPGLDIHNPQVDDVLKPGRQREIAAITAALAEFKPTKILVERVAATPDLVDPGFAAFTAGDLSTKRSERVQIAYRLARQMGHAKVFAIDEQPEDGEPDYFPFGKLVEWAAANGAKPRVDSVIAAGGSIAKRIEEAQAKGSIAATLRMINSPEADLEAQGFYYETLGIGDARNQPGADLNAMWYLRNAKIFAKLDLVAEPGDRLLVIYGAGHNYWLRHFASHASGYRSIDPTPYLEKAEKALR